MNAHRSGECLTCTSLCTRLDVFVDANYDDRINTKTWELQPNTWLTSMSRTWFGMSRMDTIASLLALYADCREYIDDSLRNSWNKQLVTFHIRESISGMRVIRDTYKNTSTYEDIEATVQSFCVLIGEQTLS
jgi:hypothetical protein